MSRIKSSETRPAAKPAGTPPVVVMVEHEQYGLNVGPDGGYKNPQMKHTKWGYVVGGVFDNGNSALMEIVKYLEEGHPDFPGILKGVEKFVEEFTAWKASRAA